MTVTGERRGDDSWCFVLGRGEVMTVVGERRGDDSCVLGRGEVMTVVCWEEER